jgi:beta-lactamase class A
MGTPCFRHRPSLLPARHAAIHAFFKAHRGKSSLLGSPERMLNRRRFARTILAFLFCGASTDRSGFAAGAEDGFARLAEAFAKIEAESGGRLGVAVLDTQSGAAAGHRADERFPICSTFKLLAAAATLAKVDAGKEQLARRVRIEPGDLLSYAPIAKQHVNSEDLSIGELCEAAVTVSDNTAANLILQSLGGPSALTRYARSLGDEYTRLDRIEPDLNEAAPDDPRDTTTPAAMAKNLRVLAAGAALSPASRDQLIAWLLACKTGDAKLRAGLPKAWRIGDKTGAGGHGSSNDVAVVWPPNRPPVLIAAYLTGAEASDDKHNATHAAVARAVAEALTG